MKRYLAFYGNEYYPMGGMEDFVGDFDTEEDAKDAIIKAKKLNNRIDEGWAYDWAQIYDTEIKRIVYEINSAI